MRTSFYDFCVKQGHRALLAQWDEVRNAPLTTGNVSFGSHRMVWWRCPVGHSYDSVVKSRVLGTGCPVCAGRPLSQCTAILTEQSANRRKAATQSDRDLR